MGIGILAPVPATIIGDALDACSAVGVVAFGTNARELFEKIEREYGVGIPVIIQPTVRYGDPKDYGRKSFSATFVRFQKANAQGLHPDPAKRPAATLSLEDPDTPAMGFWEVSDLKQLPKKVPLNSMRAEGKKTPLPPTYTFHGPLIVVADFL